MKKLTADMRAEVADALHAWHRAENAAPGGLSFEIWLGARLAVWAGMHAPEHFATRMQPQGTYERDAEFGPSGAQKLV